MLHIEGKLHKRLISRTRALFIISFILSVIVAYNFFFREINLSLALIILISGFLLGFFLFSRMNVVHWNEEESIVKIGKMDTFGYITLVLYICFEIGLRTFLRSFFPASAIILIFSGILGTILGRAIGLIIEIHKVFRASH